MTTAEAIVILERVLRVVAMQDEAYRRNALVYDDLKRSIAEERAALEHVLPILRSLP